MGHPAPQAHMSIERLKDMRTAALRQQDEFVGAVDGCEECEYCVLLSATPEQAPACMECHADEQQALRAQVRRCTHMIDKNSELLEEYKNAVLSRLPGKGSPFPSSLGQA